MKLETTVEVGSKWVIGNRVGPFFRNRIIEVTEVVQDFGGALVRYRYGSGIVGRKPMSEFQDFIRDGRLAPVPARPAKSSRFQPGQCWVTVRSLCPLKLRVRFEILRIEGQKVYYKYETRGQENHRFISDLETYFDKEWIIPAPALVQSPTARKPEDPFASPFKAPDPFEVGLDIKQVCERTHDAIFRVNYAELEKRAAAVSAASVPARIQELLSEYQGKRFTSALMQKLDHEIRMVTPVGLSHNLICDAGGQNLRVELEGPAEHYQIDTYSVDRKSVV